MQQHMREMLMEYAEQETKTSADFSNAGEKGIRSAPNTSNTIEVYQIPNKDFLILLHPFYKQVNGASPVHRHSYFEMGIVFQGECVSISDGMETRLQAEDLFITSLQAVHQLKTFSPEDYVFNIMISTSMFDDDFFRMIGGDDLFSQFFMNSILNIPSDSCLILRQDVQTDITYFVTRLLYDYLITQKGNISFWRLLLASIFHVLSQRHRLEMDEKSRKENNGLTIDPVIKYLSQNYADATLKSTADHFHYTTRFMTSFMAKYTGTSFSNVIQELRLQNAKKYILHSALSFDEIARKVGYNKRNYLDYLFKKKYGMTMSQYRKRFTEE